MKNIYPIVEENKKEAIELLKNFEGKEINFSEYVYVYGEECLHEALNEYPFVLIEDRYGTIGDYAVSKVKLNDDNKMEIFIDSFSEWFPLSYALSTTDNNVYIAIGEITEYMKQ